MPESWKQWEGQVADGKFPLRQYLGGTERAAVFLTQTGEPQPQNFAIKLVLSDLSSADHQLSRWRAAAQVSHPSLLRLFQMGRCKLRDKNLLYLVMEYAEENLSQVVPQRSLTPAEARDMLEPVSEVLAYLHSKGLVHGRIKPANIHATADQLKLSSDSLRPIADSKRGPAQASAYDAPEVAAKGFSAPADVWSLGMTLVEALTQQFPVRPKAQNEDPALPNTLAPPFLEIARNSLRLDPQRRWTVAEIALRLNPASAPPAIPVAPLSVPLSSVAPLPPASRQAAPSQPPRAQVASQQQPKQSIPPRPVPQQQAAVAPRSPAPSPGPRYLVPALVAAFVIAAILVVPKLLNRDSNSQSEPSSAVQQPPVLRAAEPKPQSTPPPKREAVAHPAVAQSAPSPAQKSLRTASDKEPVEKGQSSAAAAPSAAVFHSDSPAKTSSASSTRGDVLDQVLPDVSQKARDSIQGRVRVTVKLQVDAAGNVSEAQLDSPGPSKYFADLSLKAARRWEFQSPEVDGRSVPSEWKIRFEFSQTDTKAFPKQEAP